MIQRIQSIYLAFIAICAAIYLNIPFMNVDNNNVLASHDVSLLILASIVSIIALITIFLFKNRKLQMNLCLSGIVFSILTAGTSFVKYYQKNPLTEVGKSIGIGSIVPLLIIVLFILAFSAIKKDDKLVKSMDRLR